MPDSPIDFDKQAAQPSPTPVPFHDGSHLYYPGDRVFINSGEAHEPRWVQAVFNHYDSNDNSQCSITITAPASDPGWSRHNGLVMGCFSHAPFIRPAFDEWQPPADAAPGLDRPQAKPSEPPSALETSVEIETATLDALLRSGYDTYGVYRNEATDSASCGQVIFLAYGPGCTLAEPPPHAPDGSYGMGWKFCLIGTVAKPLVHSEPRMKPWKRTHDANGRKLKRPVSEPYEVVDLTIMPR